MKVKKYTAPTMPEAMNQIRKELGSDAVILNSKVVKTKGFLGFFQKNNIEVIAAMDPHPTSERKIDKNITSEIKKDKGSLNKNSQQVLKSQNEEVLLAEIKKLKNAFESQQNTREQSFPAPIEKIYRYLLQQEVGQPIAHSIAESLLEKFYLNNKKVDKSQLFEWLKEEIDHRLSPFPFGDDGLQKKVIHFVGPTGVGKTTTIAKIAAHAMMKENKKVALITMDTYRIGAIDQLKTYSKILGIPLEVAYNIEDFVSAKKKFENFDIILVDTAGRNYKQIEFINQLQENIDFSTEDEMYLVLSITTKSKELEQVYQQFAPFSIKKVIVTKMDETSEYGSILNLILNCKVGIAFMTNGQNVPDDLLISSKEKVTSMIVGEWNHD